MDTKKPNVVENDTKEIVEVEVGKKRFSKKWIALMCVGVICCGLCAYIAFKPSPIFEVSQAAIMDANGQLAPLGNREEELKKIMDDSKVAVSMNSMPYFENGSAKGNLKIENMEFNKRLMKVEIYLDKDLEAGIKDKPIYATEKLLPHNSHINEDVLSTALSKGVYPATAYITTFDVNDPSIYLGQASVGIEIVIGN